MIFFSNEETITIAKEAIQESENGTVYLFISNETVSYETLKTVCQLFSMNQKVVPVYVKSQEEKIFRAGTILGTQIDPVTLEGAKVVCLDPDIKLPEEYLVTSSKDRKVGKNVVKKEETDVGKIKKESLIAPDISMEGEKKGRQRTGHKKAAGGQQIDISNLIVYGTEQSACIKELIKRIEKFTDVKIYNAFTSAEVQKETPLKWTKSWRIAKVVFVDGIRNQIALVREILASGKSIGIITNLVAENFSDKDAICSYLQENQIDPERFEFVSADPAESLLDESPQRKTEKKETGKKMDTSKDPEYTAKETLLISDFIRLMNVRAKDLKGMKYQSDDDLAKELAYLVTASEDTESFRQKLSEKYNEKDTECIYNWMKPNYKKIKEGAGYLVQCLEEKK